MTHFDWFLIVSGFLIVMIFSILTSRAQQLLWERCRRSERRMREQRKITEGKSHCR